MLVHQRGIGISSKKPMASTDAPLFFSPSLASLALGSFWGLTRPRPQVVSAKKITSRERLPKTNMSPRKGHVSIGNHIFLPSIFRGHVSFLGSNGS